MSTALFPIGHGRGDIMPKHFHSHADLNSRIDDGAIAESQSPALA